MRHFSLRGLLVTTVVAVAATSLSMGCSSSGRAPESEHAIDSMQAVHDKVVNAKTQVDKVTADLDQLTSGSDLAASFKTYSGDVDALKSTGDDAAKRGEDMRARKKAYLDRWEKESAEIQNPDVKETLDARRQRVITEFDKISGMADDVKQAYVPFLAGNQDIQKALSLDLNPEGVKSLSPVITKSKSDGAVLSQKLDALSTELDSVIGRMSPSGSSK